MASNDQIPTPAQPAWMQTLWKKKTVIALALVLIVGAGGGYNYWKNQQATSMSAATYREQVVKRATVTKKITALGTLKPIRTQEIRAKADGTILQQLVQETDAVAPNQPILTMDNSSSEAQLAGKQAALAQARYNLKAALDGAEPEEITKSEATLRQDELNRAQAEAKVKRVQTLYDSGASTKEELEQAQTELATIEQKLIADQAALDLLRKGKKPEEIAALRAKVTEAEAALKAAMRDFADTEISVPFAGRVLTIPVKAGEFVAQETVLATVADLSVIQGSFYIKEIDIAKIKLGMEAVITVDALEGKVFKGKVSRVGQNPKTIDNVVNYEVLVDIDNTDGQLRSGMTMSTDIALDQKTDVLTVPLDAIINRNGTDGVMVSGPQGPAFVPVKMGLRDDSNVEIIEGLQEGDRLLIETQPVQKTTTSTSKKSTTNSTRRNSSPIPGMGGPPGMGPP
ncbi:efflux RND transporter periplasmic adaptor subunit [Heliophilum fasciatum]|uniref:HlyD family secretion protein n=1 Tax=Heliophilum fasciatum TaxID=35700 RepID=A0A4R2RVJ0_9FIRM|nr:efflux RND transporter periplasmic adaptor subunit [Heliophilum fasciatum]MCW2278218.1 HlyD family secretion protein [Heliophilum fasciatum]TCP63961.1 HlyD family secretion protein [Heliophilum fasciatum]